MTAIADLLTPGQRQRLSDRLAELRQLDHLVRERTPIRPPQPPIPLQQIARERQEVHDQRRQDGST